MGRQVEAITVRSEVSFAVHRFQPELRRAIVVEAVLCWRLFCQAVSYALFCGGRQGPSEIIVDISNRIHWVTANVRVFQITNSFPEQIMIAVPQKLRHRLRPISPCLARDFSRLNLAAK